MCLLYIKCAECAFIHVVCVGCVLSDYKLLYVLSGLVHSVQSEDCDLTFLSTSNQSVVL